ncbi:hypothetical protein AAGW05_10630, partial [Arthrobacter sp. LAPM80]
MNQVVHCQLVIEGAFVALKGASPGQLVGRAERLIGRGSVRFDDCGQCLHPIAGSVPGIPRHTHHAVVLEYTIAFICCLFGIDPVPGLEANNGVDALIAQ